MQSSAPKNDPLDLIYWGSCVTRDSEGFFPAGAVVRRRYIARQSLCSTGHPVDTDPWLASLNPLNSKFQQRMLLDDLAGSALTHIRQTLDDFPHSFLIMDLVDERGGIFRGHDSAVATNSLEAIASGLSQALPAGWDHKEFTSLDFFFDFTQAASVVAAALQEMGIWERTYVIKARWAEKTTTGEPTPRSFGMTASEANDVYADLYSMMDETGWKTLDPGIEPLADTGHKWGLAPFHYSDDYYLATVDQILRATRYKPVGPSSPLG